MRKMRFASGLLAAVLAGTAAQRVAALSTWDPSLFQVVTKGNGVIALPVEVPFGAPVDFGASLDSGNTLVGVELFAKSGGEPSSDGNDWTRCETSGAMACGALPVSFGNAQSEPSDYGTTYQIRAIPKRAGAFRARMVVYFKHASTKAPDAFVRGPAPRAALVNGPTSTIQPETHGPAACASAGTICDPALWPARKSLVSGSCVDRLTIARQ